MALEVDPGHASTGSHDRGLSGFKLYLAFNGLIYDNTVMYFCRKESTFLFSLIL